MRVGERRIPMAGWAFLLWAALGVLTACPKEKDTGRTSVYTNASEVRLALLAETTNYSFGQPREQTNKDTTLAIGAPPPLPTVTIATMTRIDTATRPHANRFIHRLHSNAAYAPLGLAPGDNYVWRDSTTPSNGGTWRILVVPRDTAYPMVWLRTDSMHTRTMIDSGGDAPFMRATNGSFQCDAGCSPHCNQFDTRAAFDATRDAGSMVIRY